MYSKVKITKVNYRIPMKHLKSPNDKDSKQQNVWLKQLRPSAQSFIEYFCTHDIDDQLCDKKIFESFQSAIGNSFLADTYPESSDYTDALFEKSFNQWVLLLHEYAALTPRLIEKAYRALHYDTVNLSTYNTDELARLHAVLLEQYPEHYHSLLEEYNQILSNAMYYTTPITLDLKKSLLKPPTKTVIAKLSIFMICKLLSVPSLPSPFLTASIIFKKGFINSCDLDINDAFKFYEKEIFSLEELSCLIKFSENIKDQSHIEKIEIFCESFIASLDITDAFQYSSGAFGGDTKKYQLLMTILMNLPLPSLERIEFNLIDCAHNGIVLSGNELVTNENKNLTYTKDFIQRIGHNKLHWTLISMILCKSRPIESSHHDILPLLEILHPLLKVASKFDLEFKKLQKSQFITSHHFIVNTFDLLNSMCRETKINESLFIDYCMIGKNHTLALAPIANLSEECERLLKIYRSLCNEISAEQQTILDFDKIQSQPQSSKDSFDRSDDANYSQEIPLSNHPTPMIIANSQESSNQHLASSSGFEAESEVNLIYQLSYQSLPSLSSSTPSTSSSSSAYYSSIDLQISEDERIYLKKWFENLFSIPFDAESRVQHIVTKTYERFRSDYDKRKNANPQSNSFFQPIPKFDTVESPQQELNILSKLPDCTQKHILSSLHTIHMLQDKIRRCQEEQIDLLAKILTLDTIFKQNKMDTDVDSSIQSASLPFLNAQTQQALPKPQLNAKTLKQALVLFKISEPYSNSIDVLLDEDTQEMTADEKKQEEDFQANVMILMKNLGQANTPLLVKLYQNFPRQMQNLSALLHKQYDALITRRELVHSEQKNKRSKHTDKTTKNAELHLENITLCQDLATALHDYISKNDALNLSIAIRSFSENLLSKARHPREKQALNKRSYCFSPDEDNKNFSKTKYPISPGIMSLIKSGAPNITIQYGSPYKRNTSIFLPSKAPAREINDITPSIYLNILFNSQIYYNIRLSEILVYKTLRGLEYLNTLNNANQYFFELSNPGPLIYKCISTEWFEIDIHLSGKIIIRTTPQNYKKIDDEASLIMTPIHIEKTKKFCECLRKNFKKSPALVEIIESSVSEDHWEVLFVSSDTLRYDIYHEFCRGIKTVKEIIKLSFPYQFGEIRIMDSKWPGRTHPKYPAITATSAIITTYSLQNSPLESWTFSGLSHTNRTSWNQDGPEIYKSPDIQKARALKIFSGFNVHQLPKDEDFFSRLAPLKFLKNLIFTYQATRYSKRRSSYVFAEEAFKALLKLPRLPALKSVALTSGMEAINLSQCLLDRTSLGKSLDDCEIRIADSRKQIKLAWEARLDKISKELDQTQNSSKSSQLKKEPSAVNVQVEASSSDIIVTKRRCRSLRLEIKILTQGAEFIRRKTRECINYAIPILCKSDNDYAGSSDFHPALIDKYPNLEKITLDADLTFIKENGLWSTKHL